MPCEEEKLLKGLEALECPYLADYIQLVEGNNFPVCNDILLLISHVKRAFIEEDIYINLTQADKYLSYQKYFPYRLVPWEIFIFVLHNCTYDAEGFPRWSILFVNVGRGAGKNGYLSFEDFCLLTETNGIEGYDIDIFAMSEDNAKTSFNEIYDVLENPKNKKKLLRFFNWTKEYITNIKTKSTLKFRTSGYKSKDGGRPGKVDFDEYHAYENYKLVKVAVTGLGKKRFPKRTYITTNGDVRGGPYDDLMDEAQRILSGEIPDNGKLCFICRVESEEEIIDPTMWYKANPSLQYFPHLMREIKTEFADYLINKIANADFAVKRMNFTPKMKEDSVTSWDNVLATNQDIEQYKPMLSGRFCYGGIDYMKTTDLLSAGLLFNVDGKDIWISHTWVCSQSADLARIKAPLREWEAAGLLTFLDCAEISPDVPAFWLAQTAAELNATILKVGIDKYRFTLMRKSLQEILFMSPDKGYENILLVRPSNEMITIPTITSVFVNHNLAVGDNPLFRWAVWNSKICSTPQGNCIYGKIEPKSRKTDPFKAYVAAKCVSVADGENNLVNVVYSGGLPGTQVY